MKKIEELAKKAINACLESITGPMGPNHKLASLKITNSILQPNNKLEYNFLISIESDNRALTLGQFIPYQENGWGGSNIQYIRGYIKGYLKSLNLTDNIIIHIDVIENCTANKNLYRFLSIDEALEHNIFDKGSKIHNALIHYNIPIVFVAGNVLSGPSIGMIEILSKYISTYKPSKVLDLFSGSCSLSLISLRNGVQYVKSLDLMFPNSFTKEQYVYENDGSWIRENNDIFSIEFKDYYDLVIADPYYTLTLDFVRNKLPNILETGSDIIINLGMSNYEYWITKLKNEILLYSKNVEYYTINDEIICEIKTYKM